MSGIETGAQHQSLFEYSANREFEFAGLRMPLKDLIELCPVKGDANRMTAEAIDQFTVKVYQASGEELPDQYTYLLEQLPEKHDNKAQEQKTEEPSKQDNSEQIVKQPEPLRESIAVPKDAELPQADAGDGSMLENLVEADAGIAQRTDTEEQPQMIRDAVEQPSEDALQQITARYDALYHDLQQEASARASEPMKHAQEAPETNADSAESEVSSDTEELFAENLQTTFDIVDDESSLLAQEQSELEQLQTDTALDQLDGEFTSEEVDMQQGFAEQGGESVPEVFEPLPAVLHLESQFTEAEAAMLDEQLDFEAIPRQTEYALNEAEQGEQPLPQRPEFAAVVAAHIEALDSVAAAEADKMHEQLKTMEIIARDIVRAEFIKLSIDAPVDTEQLREELYAYAQDLLERMGRQPTENMTKRFVERLLQAELDYQFALAEARIDTLAGTHEQKLFEDNLQWLKYVTSPESWLIRVIGRLTVGFSL